MKREIEILWKLRGRLANAERHILTAGFKAVGARRTVDIYYFDPLRNGLRSDGSSRLAACFRLREQGGVCTVAYKVDHFDGNVWRYSDEYETGVTDAAVMRDIIRHLGLKPLVVVDMTKRLFESPDYEVALETVKGLGVFIEVETRHVVSDRQADAEKERIRQCLADMGIRVGAEMNAGKPELLLKKGRCCAIKK